MIEGHEYICDIEAVRRLEEDIERLNKRDGNAKVNLSYDTPDYPFNIEELQICDFGVSDNIYIVESKRINLLGKDKSDRDLLIDKQCNTLLKQDKRMDKLDKDKQQLIEFSKSLISDIESSLDCPDYELRKRLEELLK